MRADCALLVVALALAGCGGAAPASPTGFEHATAELSETLRIDGHAEDLVPISAVAVSADGTIAFNQGQDGLIRFYSATGERLGSFGGHGEGPGEFQNPYRLAWLGDTLQVFDGRLRRFTFITPELRLGHTLPDMPLLTLARRTDGSLLALESTGSQPPVIARIDADGDARQTVMPIPADEGGQARFGGGTVRLPFGNLPQYAVAPDGERVAVAMATLDGAEAETFLLTVADAHGDTLVARRYAFEGEPIPRAEGERAIDERIEVLRAIPGAADDWTTEAVAALRREAVIPPFHPPFTDLMIATDGSIWIEHRERAGQRAYSVVAADGDPVGQVLLPKDSRVGAATLEQIWVLERDELGVQSVVVYTVAWTATPAARSR